MFSFTSLCNAQTAEMWFPSVAVSPVTSDKRLALPGVHLDDCVPIFRRDSFCNNSHHLPLCLFIHANPPCYLAGVRVRPTHRGPRTT